MTTPNDLPAKWRKNLDGAARTLDITAEMAELFGRKDKAKIIVDHAENLRTMLHEIDFNALTRALSSAVPSNVVGYGEVVDGKLMQYSHAPNGAAVTPLCVASQAVPTESLGRDAEPARYFASGPGGHFYADDLKLACDILDAYDKSNCWTVTDLCDPTDEPRAPAPASVADGWSIRRDGSEVRVTAPNGIPGGMTLTAKERSLPGRILYALALALTTPDTQPTRATR